MYHYLLILHSYFRWLVLFALVFQIVWIFINHRKNKVFSSKDYQILIGLTIIYDIQFFIGWVLYLNSPLVTAFWNDISIGIKTRQLRFFGLEHMSMMTLAVMIINIVSLLVKKKVGGNGFTYLWKRYIWISLMILTSIPWSFSPFTNRPNFRF
ncbi:hypothetical protein [Sphingobacterium cellulitidis]|uniref:hypothetical protein n=1 Tax=Sphingobacterium cellulitidis TaxID=1768011 RepID=UPI000B942E59|nr:hypothetical protein [Sphingobacterium soli]MBA8986693.1 hypothetical protein [Sphingobacterium soli]OYD41063.1 hypothetical protein CHT99_15065 [Sphingobacterium cellulitidis]